MDSAKYESLIAELPLLSAPSDNTISALTTDDIDDLELVVLRDPSLVKKVLSTANTVHVRRAGPEVCSIRKAIVRLGLQRTKSLILSYSCSIPIDNTRCPAFDLRVYWYESLLLGLASSMAAHHSSMAGSETEQSCLVGGILAHIGLLVLAHHRPEDTNRSLVMYMNSNGCLYDVILDNQGINFYELGSRVLEHWGIPRELADIPRNLYKLGPREGASTSPLITAIARWAWDGYSPNSKHLNVFQSRVASKLSKSIDQCRKSADMIAEIM